MTVHLPTHLTGVHDTFVNQRQETPVAVRGRLLVEVEVRREFADLSVQRLQLIQVIQDRQERGLDPDATVVLLGRKVLDVGAAHLSQRAPLQRLEILEWSIEVIAER